MQCRLKWDGGALNRPVLLLVVALVASLLQSCPLPTGTCNDCDDSNPSPCGDREYRPETGLEIANDGVLTTDPDVVISGESSILGTHAGDGSYSPYLRTKKSILRFSPESTYTVKFNYRIVAEPDEGFELLFYSPVGGAEGNWLPSLVITGEAGETGSAELTSTLGPYTDYEVPWNIIGTGSIAVDDIEVTDSTGGLFAVENAELSCLYPAQALLPPGRVGRSYAAASAVLGGVPPLLDYDHLGSAPPPSSLDRFL
jgi:hypothetical protein